MTSSQPVVTPDSILFTPDNKRCYAYSGIVTCAGSGSQPTIADTTTMLEFTTNSEYLAVIVSWANEQTSGTADNFICVAINDVVIYGQRTSTGSESNWSNPKNLHLILPPFSKCYFGANTSADAHDWCFTVTGNAYGMVETDGYQ